MSYDPEHVQGDVCPQCNARGGKLWSEMQGEEAWAGLVYFFDPCVRCLEQGLCPGCMGDIDYVGGTDLDTLICALCGWKYDESRFYPDPPLD